MLGGVEGGLGGARSAEPLLLAAGAMSRFSSKGSMFGDLGGDVRLDCGVGVAGGEVEPDLTPSCWRY